ncbi:MAG: hypothetical protein M1334_01945 [Patescibacteria group bacterium]|nr:hypothetical protein [Patescibacteria group bacterium]
MDSLESLKKLKKIEPDLRFSRESKALILSSPIRPSYGPLNLIIRSMESSLAIALGGVLLLILLGGVSLFKFLIPDQTANLNFNNIQAEAQEINTQIKLANLNYSLSPSPAKNSNSKIAAPEASTSAERVLNLSNSGASSSLNMESALEELSK